MTLSPFHRFCISKQKKFHKEEPDSIPGEKINERTYMKRQAPIQAHGSEKRGRDFENDRNHQPFPAPGKKGDCASE
jgi:hypothetical protein